MGRFYRCAGEVLYDTQQDPRGGRKCKVNLPQSCQAWSFLQSLQPLSTAYPSFCLRVKSLGPESKIVAGIAGSAIEENRAPGHWNNTVGYHSNTGRCYSSHDSTANTGGEVIGQGDKLSVEVSYFGKKSSTIFFYKNGLPVATRYLFETDHSQYFPCLFLEKGPIELEVIWLVPAVEKQPITQTDVSHWIRSPATKFDQNENIFMCAKDKDVEGFLQGTVSLGPDLPFYDVKVEECTAEGVGPTVAIATVSPLKPTPPCVLLRDYLKWEPTNSVKTGDHIGWGVHYSPERRDRPDFDPRAEQIVLCYVVKNRVMQCFQMMLQPTGGFYPMVLLSQNASKIKVENGKTVEAGLVKELDKIYRDLLADIRDMLETDAVNKRLTLPMLRLSEALEVDITPDNCHVTLPSAASGVHALQFLHPLTIDSSYFYIEVNKLSSLSSVSLGVAGPKMPLSSAPGSLPASVGLSSKLGQLLSNARTTGNMEGETFSAGDKIGVKISAFADKVAVVLFFKNERPIGTRYLYEAERNRYLPTVSLCANGHDVDINIVWQTRVERGPLLNTTNPEHWCLPEGSMVDEDNIVSVMPNSKKVQVLQAASSLHTEFNHYEIQLVDAFDDCSPPPVIALCAASPRDPPLSSHYTQDFIRFWATGKAASSVQQGDFIGWGIIFPKHNSSRTRRREDLVICYLTLNRTVVLRRVLVLPPGGFYPVVILPPGVARVKFEFAACCIEEDPLSSEEVQQLIEDAEKNLEEEEESAKLYGPSKGSVISQGPGISRDLPMGKQPGMDRNQALGKGPLGKDPVSDPRKQLNATSYSLNSLGLSDDEGMTSRGKGSSRWLDSPGSNKKYKDKPEKKEKKSKKKHSVGKSSEKKLKASGQHLYDEEAIADQYQSKSCVIL